MSIEEISGDSLGTTSSKVKCKRHPEIKNSISEPDLTTAGHDPIRSGFPPGTTVDELWLYRRKRPSANLWPQDQIKLDEGTFKQVKSEYRRRFKNYYDFGGSSLVLGKDLSPVRAKKPEDTLRTDGLLLSLEPNDSEYNQSFIEHPIEKLLDKATSNHNSFQVINTDRIKEPPPLQPPPPVLTAEISRQIEPFLTETGSKFPVHFNAERPHLIKHPTNLKIEGDFDGITEKAEQFIEYLLTKRPDLARKATTLKLEGEMASKTENRDKYISHEYQARPPLCKKLTNLHLEGDLDTLTEKQQQFCTYPSGMDLKRSALSRQSTNLQIEGDIEFMPEYRREYKEYKETERTKLFLPVNNLKSYGGFADVISDLAKPYERQIHPQIPFLRQSESDNELQRSNSRLLSARKLSDSDLKRSSSRTQLRSNFNLNPEYGNNPRRDYYQHNKDVNINMLSPTKLRNRVPQRPKNNLMKSEGKMEISPEYSCSYVDFPRERPHLRRPEGNLSSEGEMERLTEKSEQYVPYPNAQRTESLKRKPELKLEGHFECQPEYRKAYIDYLIREKVERKQRPLDNLGMNGKRTFELVPTTNPESKLEPQATTTTALSLQQPVVVTTSETVGSSSSVASSDRGTAKLSPEKPPPSKSPSPKNGLARNKSFLELESSAFGPNLTVPVPQRRKSSSRSTSRSTSPNNSVTTSSVRSGRRSIINRPDVNTSKVVRSRSISSSRGHNRRGASSSRNSSPNDNNRMINRKFGSPVRVENLACKMSSSSSSLPPPPPPLINISTARNKWMKDSSVESAATSSFVVLRDKGEINNNNYYGEGGGFITDNNNIINKNMSKKRADNIYYREQRWVPSWHDPPPLP